MTVVNLDLEGTSVAFPSTSNAVTVLAGLATGGPFAFTDSVDLTIGRAAADNGISASGGDVTVSTTGGLTVSQAVSDSGGAVTLTGNGTINVNAEITGRSATVLGGTGADIITVTITGSTALTLDGQGGGDSYVIDFGALDSPVDIVATGNGTNAVNVNGAATADTFTVTGTQVTDNNNQEVTYSGVQQLVVNGGNAGNVFLVQGTASGVPTQINTGSGDGNIYVSSSVGDSGNLAALLGTLSIDAGASTNYLTVSEAGQTSADTVTVTNSSISGSGFTVNYQSTGTLACVNFACGVGDTVVKVQSTLAGCTTGVFNFGGNDNISVTSNAGSNQGDLAGINGQLGVLAYGGNGYLDGQRSGSNDAGRGDGEPVHRSVDPTS